MNKNNINMIKNRWDENITNKEMISEIGQNASVQQLFHGKWFKTGTISKTRKSGMEALRVRIENKVPSQNASAFESFHGQWYNFWTISHKRKSEI